MKIDVSVSVDLNSAETTILKQALNVLENIYSKTEDYETVIEYNQNEVETMLEDMQDILKYLINH